MKIPVLLRGSYEKLLHEHRRLLGELLNRGAILVVARIVGESAQRHTDLVRLAGLRFRDDQLCDELGPRRLEHPRHLPDRNEDRVVLPLPRRLLPAALLSLLGLLVLAVGRPIVSRHGCLPSKLSEKIVN